MNRQMIYDIVRDHLLSQNARSGKPGACRYRSDDGLMCAVGCLIPDSEYDDSEMEGRGADWPTVKAAVAKFIGEEISVDTQRMLNELQQVHDGVLVEYWPEEIGEVAVKFGLRP